MKKKSVVLLITAAVLHFNPAIAASVPDSEEYPSVDVEMSLQQLSEHCYYVQGNDGIATENAGFISNAGFVIGSQGVVVIDALGTPALGKKLLGKIREITDKPVKAVILTHYHADHVYGLQAFKEAGAEVIATAGAMQYLQAPTTAERLEERKQSLFPWVNEYTRLIEPDTLVSKAEKLNLGDVDILISPIGAAHSDGDLTVLATEDKVLYSGDIIFEGRLPFLGDSNTKHWLETLRKLETGGLKALVPGHGTANTQPAEAIKLTREYLAFLRKHMGDAVTNFTPFNEAYEHTDWRDFSKLPAFAETNRRNAYQVYLSMETEALAR